MKFNYINTLGVINRTPNSFSCLGESLADEAFFNKLNLHLRSPRVVTDVGFESTAPMNRAITPEEELARFRIFLYKTKSCDFSDRFISFDTYRPRNFLIMALEMKRYHPRAKFILNDVSGVLDRELKETLIKCREFFGEHDFHYIYSFTHVPSRLDVLSHDKFLNLSRPIVDQCIDSFWAAFMFFKDLGLESQLLLDPAFGFSKSYDQNWDLIYSFSTLLKGLESKKIHNPLVLGLSKKRFLRTKLNLKDPNETEGLHQKLILKLQSMTRRQLIFRVHDTSLVK